MRYSAPLDGLRALAIAGVLVFHIAPHRLTGGFAGVDVFFVVSGFLITAIILSDLHHDRFTLREFYLRRVQRLLPNLVVTIAVTLALWHFFVLPSDAAKAARHAVWALFNLSNVYVWKFLGGYWGNDAEWAPLTHTWSLGLEEQFYLLYPALLVMLVRVWPTRRTAVLMTAMLFSAVGCVALSARAPESTFYLLPTRMWELLMGAILASLRREGSEAVGEGEFDKGRLGREVVGWGGLMVVLVALVLIDKSQAFPGVVAFFPTVGATAILWSITSGGSSLAGILALPAVVAAGRRSYSVYLWHWPLITLGRTLAEFTGHAEHWGALAGGIIGVGFAFAAYALVEQPLRHRGPGRTNRLALLAVGFTLTAISALMLGQRHPEADPVHRFDRPQFFGEAYNAGKSAMVEIATSTSFTDVSHVPRTEGGDDSWRTGGIIHRHGSATPRVVVLGSSHALMYSHVIDEIARAEGVSVAFLGMPATPPFFATAVDRNFRTVAEARGFDETRKDWIRRWHPDVVFVIDRWDRRVWERSFGDAFDAFLREVAPISGRIVFLAQPPVLQWSDKFNLREFVVSRGRGSGALPPFHVDKMDAVRRSITSDAERALSRYPTLRVLRPDTLFAGPDGSVRYASGRAFYYLDDDHLTEAGAQQVRPMLHAALRDALNPTPTPHP